METFPRVRKLSIIASPSNNGRLGILVEVVCFQIMQRANNKVRAN